MKTPKKIRKIVINTKENDPVDIRCGGPAWLGFNFHVEPKTLKYWREFFKEMEKKYLTSEARVFIARPEFVYPVGKVWSEKQIKKEMQIGD